MLTAIAFYFFSAILIAVRVMVICVAESGAFGAVPDPGLLQRRRPVRAAGRGVPGDDPGRRLCRRGRRAVPVRGDDAGHRFRRTEEGRAAISAVRRADRADPGGRAGDGRQRLGAEARRDRRAKASATPAGSHQHRGARPHPLYGLHLLLPDRRPGAAGRDDRRHRADPARAARRAPPVDRGAERAHAGHVGGNGRRQAGAGG